MRDLEFNREYLGVTVTAQNYREVHPIGKPSMRNFHSKHLRAYLKGNDSFMHGYTYDELGIRHPISHKVQQKIKIWYTNSKDERVFREVDSQRDMNDFLQTMKLTKEEI